MAQRSFCRVCTNYCPIVVDVEDGRVTRVTGDSDNPVYGGYTCVKGRAQPDYLTHPDRFLTSMKRGDDGALAPIPVQDALDEIAERITAIVDLHGPRAFAGYSGTMQIATGTTSAPFYYALMQGIGTSMLFDPNTIDKGGKQVAASLFGRWMAPSQGFDRPDVALLIGINPLVTYTGLPAGNPGAWLSDALRGGMELVVVDPRRSDLARRATIHLQARPGHDAEILAAMIKVILDDGLADDEFLATHVRGVDELRAVLAPFTIDEVAARADVDAGLLRRAAEVYGRAARGYTMAGTGANMSGSGTLIEYLVLVLESVCGRWLREGEVVRAAPTLLPSPACHAQAEPPAAEWRRGDPVRDRGLTRTAAGMPTSSLAEEILQPGEGQVRGLLSWAGNPVAAFPDQLKVIEALRSLELFVQIDPWPSASAQLAHYVIAPTMQLEAPAVTTGVDGMSTRSTGYGTDQSYGQYTPAIVPPPAGSDLLDDWEVFHGLMVRLGLEVRIPRGTRPPVVLDHTPSTDELLELLTEGSRVPLDEVKLHPSGARFPEPVVRVSAAEPGWTGRLDAANPEMMADLARIGEHGVAVDVDDADYPFRLVCRRHAHVYNSSCNIDRTNRGRPYNPAFMHPDDLGALGITAGDEVEIRSRLAAIPAIVEPDPSVRPGVVSMMFGFGGGPEHDADVRTFGASPSRLVPTDRVFDRFTGQPRMSNVPVSVTPVP
ncbi:MAG: molybdopterin-dependent oxidoreductase [Acidimicrobiia bacterium]